MTMLINFVAFQVGWFAAVLGAANGLPWVGPVVIAAVLLLHLAQASRPRKEFWLVVAAAVLGTWFDSMLVTLGWVSYQSGQWHAMLAPYWIIAMWMLFATTLNVSLKWLRGRHLLGFLMGAIAGPLTYVAGQKLGAMEFVNPTAALTMLSVGWALMLPALMVLASRLNGVEAMRVEVLGR